MANFYARTVNFKIGYIICDDMIRMFIYYADDIAYSHPLLSII